MNIKDEIQVLQHLLGASLEIENLKPHVGEEQLEAANRIRVHLQHIAKIMEPKS